MTPDPPSPHEPKLVRLVGGPYDGQIMAMPGQTVVWEITEPGHWRGKIYLKLARVWVPERRHRYKLDPHWREFVGVEALPFVYAGVVEGDATP